MPPAPSTNCGSRCVHWAGYEPNRAPWSVRVLQSAGVRVRCGVRRAPYLARSPVVRAMVAGVSGGEVTRAGARCAPPPIAVPSVLAAYRVGRGALVTPPRSGVPGRRPETAPGRAPTWDRNRPVHSRAASCHGDGGPLAGSRPRGDAHYGYAFNHSSWNNHPVASLCTLFLAVRGHGSLGSWCAAEEAPLRGRRGHSHERPQPLGALRGFGGTQTCLVVPRPARRPVVVLGPAGGKGCMRHVARTTVRNSVALDSVGRRRPSNEPDTASRGG